jgi:TorA maturation chaperone TorD
MTVMTIDHHKTLVLLSSMYLCKPTPKAIAGWREALSEGSPDALTGLKAALDSLDVNSELEQENLLWEYTRLFIGPYKLPCPPWESVYTSPKRLMMQTAFDEVSDAYRTEGISVSNSGVMADHIGVELNFLALLLKRMQEDPERRGQHAAAAKAFTEDHLQKWVPAFTRDLEHAAGYTLYKELAHATWRTVADVQGEILAWNIAEGV